MCPCDTWTMENVTHDKMNSRVRGSFLSLEANQTIQWETKRKEKKMKKERKGKRKEKGDEGEPCVEERGKKKKTAIPFMIFGEPTVETRQGKRQSWSTRRELRVGTRNCGFRRVPKGRSFSYTGYFLPSGHVRVILVQL